MQINTRNVEEVIIVDIHGEIDLYNSPKIKEFIMGKMNEGYKKFIVNLDSVTYIDSSGIGTLIFCRTTLNQNNGSLKIMKIHDSVKRIFELTKLNTFFSVYDTEEDALKSFK